MPCNKEIIPTPKIEGINNPRVVPCTGDNKFHNLQDQKIFEINGDLIKIITKINRNESNTNLMSYRVASKNEKSCPTDLNDAEHI